VNAANIANSNIAFYEEDRPVSMDPQRNLCNGTHYITISEELQLFLLARAVLRCVQNKR